MAEKIKIGLAIMYESFGAAKYAVRKAGYEMAIIDVKNIIQEDDPESPSNRVALNEMLNREKVRAFIIDYTGLSLLPELKRVGGLKPTVVTVDWPVDVDRSATKAMVASGLKVVRYDLVKVDSMVTVYGIALKELDERIKPGKGK